MSPSPSFLILTVASLGPIAMTGCGTRSSKTAVSSEDGAVNGESDAATRPATFISCATDEECPQVGDLCQACFDGGIVCASSRCINGGCQEYPLDPTVCPGPVSAPCFRKACGNACQQCSTSDGSCYPGICNSFGACKAQVPDCSASDRPCTPSDAIGIGDCNAIFGWAWDGSGCVPVVGCVCHGSDCVDLAGNFVLCAGQRRCFRDAGVEM
jgi:hypothetical protein